MKTTTCLHPLHLVAPDSWAGEGSFLFSKVSRSPVFSAQENLLLLINPLSPFCLQLLSLYQILPINMSTYSSLFPPSSQRRRAGQQLDRLLFPTFSFPFTVSKVFTFTLDLPSISSVVLLPATPPPTPTPRLL